MAESSNPSLEFSDVSAAAAAVLLLHTARGGSTLERQSGQSEWEYSHISIQGAWNECLHLGNCLTSSPSSKADKQTAHS